MLGAVEVGVGVAGVGGWGGCAVEMSKKSGRAKSSKLLLKLDKRESLVVMESLESMESSSKGVLPGNLDTTAAGM